MRTHRSKSGSNAGKVDVVTYLEGPESMGPMELVHGIVREPPAPRFGHQSVLTHLGALLDAHVRAHRLGIVAVAPVDVVLDHAAALVVQPDIVFVAADRLSIVRERIFGAPDLVVEVLSPGTARRDRTTKLAWYQRYGVRECWLVNPNRRAIEVVTFDGGREHRQISRDASPVRSAVLPTWSIPTDAAFD